MVPKYFDSHTHINLKEFADDYREAVGRALASGVGFVNVGTELDDSLLAVNIAHEFEKEPVYAAVGFHPEYAVSKNFDREAFKRLALDQKTVAIGECGLDFYRVESSKYQVVRKKQVYTFERQIKIAHEVQKPLMIHCRDAFGDLIEILIHNSKFLIPAKPGLIHFFTGTKEDAQKLLEMGFAFTFGGAITYPPKSGMPDYRALVEYLPLDRILSETDAPLVAPVPYRGKRNEPAYVVEVVKKLAEIKNISVEEMAARTVENAKRTFGLS